MPGDWLFAMKTNQINLFYTNCSTDMKPGLKISILKIQTVTNEIF